MRVRRPLLTAIVAGLLAIAALGAAGTTTHASAASPHRTHPAASPGDAAPH